MHTRKWIIAAVIALLSDPGAAATRIKDIAYVQGVRNTPLIGYGLVVGLNGTGDTQRSTFTLQSVSSMLKRFGVTVPQQDLRLRNVAAVMVTGTVPGFAREGGAIDIVVSSMGDATSLQGGTLLLTPLSAPGGEVYALGQGPLSVGGISVRQNGSEFRRNHTAAGRVPAGAVLERGISTTILRDSTMSVVLLQADFTTAVRVAEAVNAKFGVRIARADDGSAVRILIPPDFRSDGRVIEFVSQVEGLEIAPDVAARVVLNERTGTIVVGGNVTILPVAISHGGVNIEIESLPVISQPNAFSQGQTVNTRLTAITAGEDTTTVMAFNSATTIQDVAKALNALRVSPRDIIAIFQALRESGALKAELVII